VAPQMIDQEIGCANPMSGNVEEDDLKMHNDSHEIIEGGDLQPDQADYNQLQADLSNNELSNHDLSSQNDSLHQDESIMEGTSADGISEVKVVDEEDTVQENLDIHDNAVTQNLDINRESTITQNLEMNDENSVTENLDMNDENSVPQNLVIENDTDVPQNLDIDDDADVPQNLDIDNDTDVPQNLDIDNDTDVPQNLDIDNDTDVPQNLDIGNDTDEPRNLDIDNENTMPQSLDINENTEPQNLDRNAIKPSREDIDNEPIVNEQSNNTEVPIPNDAPPSPVVKGESLDEDVMKIPLDNVDPRVKEQQDLIENSVPATMLEAALYDELNRKESHIQRLSGEVMKLKAFISKRKQTYKRKRKDEGAPTRALSAYNIFVQDCFEKLAKENEAALKSADSDAQLKRVPPASLVASTGNHWKALPAKEKLYYEDRAKKDRKRYDDQMAKYHPPDKQANRKRNKTGYNMFFSAHVIRLKQSESGVPSERGSVARLVGNAWKELTPEDKQYYEREADKQNGMVSGDEDERIKEADDGRRSEYAQIPQMGAIDPNMHRQAMPAQMGHTPVAHQQSHHDPRVHYPPPGPAGHYQPYPSYYDYHQPHHPPPPPNQGQRSGQQQQQQQRAHHPGGGYQYHPSHYAPYHEQG